MNQSDVPYQPSANFWWHLPLPIIGLSPMDGVTDHPLRYIQKKYGSPHVLYTEFASVEGLCHGASHLLKDFLFDETQRPIVGQIYGTTPDFFRQAAIALCQLGFDGIDINMGCPAKNVAHSGAGAALIKTPALAQKIIAATKQGVQEYLQGFRAKDCPNFNATTIAEIERRHAALPAIMQEPRSLPVSVKTRIGFDSPVVASWITTLLEMEPTVIAVHGRTLKQQYGGTANWEAIAEAAALVHATPHTRILGNGDVQSLADAQHKIATYGVDGILIGRASFGNPYVFKPAPPLTTDTPPGESLPNIFQVALEHAQLFEVTYSHQEKYSFMPMRKHLGWYVRSIPNASQIRVDLFQTNSSLEVEAIFRQYGLI